MKRKFYTGPALALAGSAALLLSACTATDSAGNTSAAAVAPKSGEKPSASAPAQAADAAHPDRIRRMGPAELQELVEGGKAVVYDTRSKMSYDQEHIKGALSMPHEEAAKRAPEFPRDKTLVFYCT